MRLIKILEAFNIQYDTNTLRCIINELLAKSLQNAVPLHQDAGDRHLGISEPPLTTTEWTEVSNQGQFGFNFHRRGNGGMGPLGEPYPEVSEQFTAVLYLPGHQSIGSNVKANVSRGAYYTYNPSRDAQTYDICGQQVPNRDMRIIARTIFGEPVYDNAGETDPAYQYQLITQTPWPLRDMQAMGLLDGNGSPAIDPKTPVEMRLAIKELIALPIKIISKLKKYGYGPLAGPIEAKIAEIKQHRGILDGVIDDLTGQPASYPAFAIKIDYLRWLLIEGGVKEGGGEQEQLRRQRQIDTWIKKLDNQAEQTVDISAATIEEIEKHIQMEVDHQHIENISDDGDFDKAIDAAQYQLFYSQIITLTQSVIQQYIEAAGAACVAGLSLSLKQRGDLVMKISNIVFIAGGKAMQTGALISPTEICKQIQQ